MGVRKMISIPLLKKEIRSTWILFLVFVGILTMYVTIVLSMFDPDLGNILAEFEEALPGIMAAFGMTGAAEATLVQYAASYLFGFIMLLFPILFSMILSNRLVAKYVDNGSMAYLLATPNTRKKLAFTQGSFLWVALTLLMIVITVIGIVFSQVTFPNELEIGKYILLHVGVLGLHTTISGIGFLASCIFNETKWSYIISAGIPLAGYILQMIASFGDKYENLKYVTFFSLFSTDKLLAGDSSGYIMVALLYFIGFLLYFIGGKIFTKRNLPL